MSQKHIETLQWIAGVNSPCKPEHRCIEMSWIEAAQWALDHIDSLREAWHYEQKMRAAGAHWRSVEDTSPDPLTPVLVRGSKRLQGPTVAYWQAHENGVEWLIETCSSCETIYPPKEWMPLPAGDEAKEGA